MVLDPSHRAAPLVVLRGLVVCALAASGALVGSGCPSGACQVDTDCTGGFEVCDEGTCGPIAPTPAESCTNSNTCGDQGECVAGECAFKPSCQRVSGTFQLVATCGPDIVRTTVTAVTDPGECPVAFEGIVDGSAFSIGFVQVPVALEPGQTSLTLLGCTGAGAWSSVEGVGYLAGCALRPAPAPICDVAVAASAFDAAPCFLGGSDCAGTCRALDTLVGVPAGVCE